MDRLLRAAQAHAPGDDHPQDSLTGDDPWVIDIEQAEYAGGHRLRLRFSDGTERVMDFEPFLSGSANPLIRRFLDPELFQRFGVQHGDLIWGDYDLCFPVADLYDGRL
ncbi:MAG: DUF2442 domain-containing protein [Candidatus Latescibacterota bacterium]